VPRKLDAVYNEDCIEGLAELAEGSIDLAFADDVYQDRREASEYEQWCGRWIGEIARVIKDDGTFWLAIGDEYAAELKVLMQREHGLHCRSWVVWYYTFGVNCKNKFTRSHAHLFHMVKDPERFTFNVDEIRVPSARQLVYGDRRANPKGRLPDDTWIYPWLDPSLRTSPPCVEGFVLRPQDLPQGFREDDNTWYFPRVAGTFKERAGFHGCQMPEQLLGRIIRACSTEGETVLDPFAGSGTTLAVAKKLGRRYLGFELSADYTRQVNERLESISPGDPLNGSAQPLSSAPDTARGRRLEDKKPRKKRTKRSAPSESALLWPDEASPQ